MNTIINKLRLDKYNKITILNKPKNITDFSQLEFKDKLMESNDCIIVFIYTLEEMSNYIKEVDKSKKLEAKGRLFFAYPKKNNKEYPGYIERDEIFPYLKVDEEDGYVANTTLKFSRMVSLNDTFTIVGLSNEPVKKKKNVASQRVEDYIDKIDDLRLELEKDKQALKFFDELTDGYKRNWTRFVYSAKSKETKEKRIATTKDILKEGYKSIDLYRKKGTN